MPRKFLPLLEVHDKMRGWTVLVQVVEKGHEMLSNAAPPKKYQRLVLTDYQVNRLISKTLYYHHCLYI